MMITITHTQLIIMIIIDKAITPTNVDNRKVTIPEKRHNNSGSITMIIQLMRLML